MIRFIPNENKRVIDPSTNKPVPKDGVILRKADSYWRRRVEDGDGKLVEESKKKKSTDTVTPKTESKDK